MIELSTLTGACAVALGYTYSAIFSNSDKLANKLIETGN
jgi:leucyl aminopeptidase